MLVATSALHCRLLCACLSFLSVILRATVIVCRSSYALSFLLLANDGVFRLNILETFILDVL